MTNYPQLDPRTWATGHPRLTVAVFAVASCIMLYGNIVTEKGGVLEDSILDPHNPYRQSDLYVREKRADGFIGADSLLFLLKFPSGIRSPADLRRLRMFTERVKDEFGSSVLSLSEIDEYRDTGDELLRQSYIPEEFPDGFDIDTWKHRVKADPTVFGTLIGRDFEWAAIVRYLPPGYDNVAEYRRTVEFLEERTIPWWEWVYKTNIKPKRGVGVAGGFMMRGLLDQGLKVDNALLVGMGVALAFPVFIWSLGSRRQAIVGLVGVVALGFLWSRGTIGLAQLLGFDIKERLYTLLAYTNCIVQGVSFVLHKFEAFNEIDRAADRPTDLAERWNRARGNDRLIGLTALIAILGFATLTSFQVLSVRELGFVSAMGVFWLFVLATVLVPALHIVVSPAQEEALPTRGALGGAAFRQALESIAAACTNLAIRFNSRSTALVAGGGTGLLVLLAVGLIWPANLMLIKMVPGQFLEGTAVGDTMNYLDAPQRLGRDALQLLVEPSQGGDIYEPAYLASVSRYRDALLSQSRSREVLSAVTYIGRVSAESLRKPLPTTRQEARAVFNLVEGGLNTVVARQLYYSGGMRMTLHFVGVDSNVSGKIIESALTLARDRFPELRVYSFGTESLYPQLDLYIRSGKPFNVLGSQWIVVAICWFGLAFNNRRRWARAPGAPLLRPFLGAFYMSIPFLFSSAIITIVMIVFRVPLDAGTASIAALAINASVDFAIYYADAYQHGLAECRAHRPAVQYAMRHKGRVVLEDMILNSICFLPLLASRFEPIRDVGWIMVVMLTACAFGTVVVMPALFYSGLRART